MKRIIQLLTAILLTSSVAFCQKIPLPDSYFVVDTVSGDLDKDGIMELVVAYNTKKQEEDFENVPRELRIYKKENGLWVLWKRSSQALYGSQEGGMMGDPFGQIEIINGILHISQGGGSSWKWAHTDKYRYQNGEFNLIGYTSLDGRLCEYWEKVDFNLSTGKMIVKKEYEDCESTDQEIYKRENETLYKKGISITLQNRRETEVKIVTPKYGHEVYL